jgi:hypothetical protein
MPVGVGELLRTGHRRSGRGAGGAAEQPMGSPRLRAAADSTFSNMHANFRR